MASVLTAEQREQLHRRFDRILDQLPSELKDLGEAEEQIGEGLRSLGEASMQASAESASTASPPPRCPECGWSMRHRGLAEPFALSICDFPSSPPDRVGRRERAVREGTSRRARRREEQGYRQSKVKTARLSAEYPRAGINGECVGGRYAPAFARVAAWACLAAASAAAKAFWTGPRCSLPSVLLRGALASSVAKPAWTTITTPTSARKRRAPEMLPSSAPQKTFSRALTRSTAVRPS